MSTDVLQKPTQPVSEVTAEDVDHLLAAHASQTEGVSTADYKESLMNPEIGDQDAFNKFAQAENPAEAALPKPQASSTEVGIGQIAVGK